MGGHPEEGVVTGVPKILAAPENARDEQQRKQMEEANATGSCPFCDIDWGINTETYQGIKLLQGMHWRFWPSAYPTPHSEHHLLLVAREHVTDMTKLHHGAWSEMGRLLTWATEQFGITGGGIVMRFGPFEKSAGTVAHLHVNLIEPSGKGPTLVVLHKDATLSAYLAAVNEAARAAAAAAPAEA